MSFLVDAAHVDETPLDRETPAACVERLALAKARAALTRHPGSVVLGADTTVVLDREMLGKPATDDEARSMLQRLSGRAHHVLTGVAVASAHAERVLVVQTTVWMLRLTNEQIAAYVASGEPRDKAGAYAIQGLASRFIPRIDGSYTNVVGLPVPETVDLLKECGILD